MLYEEINELLETKYTSNQDIDWGYISRDCRLEENFIEKYKDRLDWDNISEYQTLSESFIEGHKDLVNWDKISDKQTLSEPFIKKYKDLVSWNKISRSQTLSEKFIGEHETLVNWVYISGYQILSPEFMEKYRHFLHKDIMLILQPFIKSTDPRNVGSQVYQKTKEQGWFIGYYYLDEPSRWNYFYYNLSQVENHIKDRRLDKNFKIRKIKVYWKDLDLTYRAKKYELIREVKVCCMKK